MQTSKKDETTPSLVVTDRHAIIRLNRPASHNRLEQADLMTLEGFFAEIAGNSQIRALVLTAGGASFCSGFDLASLTGGTIPSPRFDTVVDQLAALPIPTVAAINGNIYGGAVDLALACDFRIGVAGMKLNVPAARLGMLYYPSGLERSVQRLGVGPTKRIFMLAETFDTAALLACGYLDQAIDPARLDETASTLAAKLAANAPHATQGMKRTIDRAAAGTLDHAQALADHLAVFGGSELAEGLRAIKEKREPHFP